MAKCSICRIKLLDNEFYLNPFKKRNNKICLRCLDILLKDKGYTLFITPKGDRLFFNQNNNDDYDFFYYPQQKNRVNNIIYSSGQNRNMMYMKDGFVELWHKHTLNEASAYNFVMRKIGLKKRLFVYPIRHQVTQSKDNLKESTTESFTDCIFEIDDEQLEIMLFKEGEICLFNGLYQDAIDYFDKALEINPKGTYLLGNKGVALENLQKYNDALKCYDEVLNIDPEDRKALSNKGAVLVKLGKYEEAITYYDKALKIEPNDIVSNINKALALFELKKYEEAIKFCNNVLRIDSKNDIALNVKNESLIALEKLDRNYK